ncbi:MAG: N-acetyl-anhydromuranmyl-L-alanine amidase [Cycloclasticus sp. symbiont of Poecilosclerida sp. M]|nr:MAG: N-acetyl-anhydromuranmyl-L-alanine amidase [Cycloclasticus sp. symbiont of Poecilosclerida sp. M]
MTDNKSSAIQNNWLTKARRVPSPNKNERPETCPVKLIIIHGISLPPNEFGGDSIEAFFTNQLDSTAHPYFKEIEGLQVSSHILIKRNGDTVQFVPFHERAWHAGVSCFKGEKDCNDFSIGIELEGADEIPYTQEQYQQLTFVCKALMKAYPELSNETIVGHCDVSAGRKTDPGESFDWPAFKSLLSRR